LRRRQQDIAWGVSEFRIAGDCGDNGGLDPAEIEGVRLEHQHGPAISGLGAARSRQVSPPDFPALNPFPNYQSSFGRDLNCACLKAGSTSAGNRE
jgi:hypothetical protein